MEILKVYVNITATHEVVSENVTKRMVLFDGYAEGEYFKGTILSGAVDTQTIDTNGKTELSARYILKGFDNTNTPCHIYIDNNAESDSSYTVPHIVTDSEALKWLENEKLTGRIENSEGHLVIVIGKLDKGKI